MRPNFAMPAATAASIDGRILQIQPRHQSAIEASEPTFALR